MLEEGVVVLGLAIVAVAVLDDDGNVLSGQALSALAKGLRTLAYSL